MSVHFKEAGHWGHKGAKTCGSVDYVRTGSDAGSEGGDGWGEKRRRELGEKMEAAGQTARQMLEKMQYGGGNTPEFSKVPLLYSCCAFVFHCMQRYHMDQRAVCVRRDLAQTSQSIVKR